jgi:hypothetical protein
VKAAVSMASAPEKIHAVFEPAPIEGRVRAITLIVSAIMAAASTVPWIEALVRNKPLPWAAVFLPLGLMGLLIPIWLGARIRRYEVNDGELRVVRPFHTACFPIAGLAEVSSDRQALAGAIKVIGNDGFGAIAGRFHSRKLGRFRAYVTDRAHAIVLRWPDRCVVISPNRTYEFVQCLRKCIPTPP